MDENKFQIKTVEEQIIDYFNQLKKISTKKCCISEIEESEILTFDKNYISGNEDVDLALQSLLENKFIKLVEETDETVSYINLKLELDNKESKYNSFEDMIDSNLEQVLNYLRYLRYDIYKTEITSIKEVADYTQEELNNINNIN